MRLRFLMDCMIIRIWHWSLHGKHVNCGYIAIMKALNDHCIHGVQPAYYLNASRCEAYGDILKKWDQFCILPRTEKSMVLFHITILMEFAYV